MLEPRRVLGVYLPSNSARAHQQGDLRGDTSLTLLRDGISVLAAERGIPFAVR